MSYFWGTLGWIWSKRKFLLVTITASLLFFVWFFPFGDLSDLLTSTIARATGNQIYLQVDNIDLNLLPTIGVSASKVSIETPAFPALEASKLKISPSLLSILFNAWTFKKAAGGDPDAVNKLQTHLGISVAAQGVLGSDIDASWGSGAKTDAGHERSKVSLVVEKLDLAKVRKWADLSFEMQGQANFETNMLISPGMVDQPEGDIELQVNKFNLPGTTLMIPFNGAMMPINLPTLTLSNVLLRGRLLGGALMIEEGTFGKSNDPINGRIKGQLALRLQSLGGSVQPVFGAYNLTVDLNTSKQVDKEMGFAFFLFDSAKTATPSGSHFLFRAQGQGIGPNYPPPSIARINSF